MTRADIPGPMRRRGPRPLLLHLGLVMLTSRASSDGWWNWKPNSPNWKLSLELVQAHLAQGQNTEQPEAIGALFAQLAPNHDFIAGIAAYRRHPWQRDLPEPPVCWEEGGSRLLDYAPGVTDGPAILFVPSLVNSATVLDLMAGHSMLRFLADAGCHPLLLDWGWPGERERAFTLSDYIAGRLERALVGACAQIGRPVILAGYCMGGTLAVASAQRRPDCLRGLALLATPWDFQTGASQTGEPTQAGQLAGLLPLLEPLMTLTGTLPVDALQTLFTLLDPVGVATKYRGFATLDPLSERARMFVALEDWLNDGVPLAAPVARACLAGWYGVNEPMRGAWHVAGAIVDPRQLRLPCFIAAPVRDRIVPPESSRPLAELIPGAVWHQPASGHVGMVAGRHAETVLWRPFLDWLRHLS
ncbi:MAG: alpha/beta hydrolase [Acetobacteraceae bacterium]|nr:alpha/beta hydrolase [Acetobacteraceae bacterium]